MKRSIWLFFTPFRRKPESRSAQKYGIPGRASLARNDDFLLLSRVLQEAPVKTGIQSFQKIGRFWIPACAGMTGFYESIGIRIPEFLRNQKRHWATAFCS